MATNQEALQIGAQEGVIVRPLPKRKSREVTPQGKSHPLRNAIIAALVLGSEGVGAVVQENVNHKPISGYTLAQDAIWPGTLAWNLIGNLFEKAPLVFDNKNDNGVIGDNDIRRIFPDQEGQFNIEPVSTPDAFIFPFPFNPPKGTTIEYNRRLSEVLPSGVDKSGAKERGIKDNYQLSIPKDSIMFSSMNAHIFISQSPNQNDPNLAQEMRIIYYDPNANMTYVMWYAFDKPVKTYLMGSKDFITFGDQEWKKLPEINAGDQIAELLENTNVGLRLMSFKGVNVAGASFVENFVLKSPNFTTDSDSNLPVLQK